MGAYRVQVTGVTPFSRQLQEWRQAKNVSQRDAADAMKIDRTDFSMIERGLRDPSGAEKIAIANYYRKPMVMDASAYVIDREYVPSWSKNGNGNGNGHAPDLELRVSAIETKLKELGIEL